MSEYFSVGSVGVTSVFVYRPTLGRDSGCPYCGSQGLLEETSMFSDGTNVKYKPRLLYGISENHMLVSRMWKCVNCGQMILGHNKYLMEQDGAGRPESFILYSRHGITCQLASLIVNFMSRGE